MHAAAAISRHPVAPSAIGEVIGELLEAVGAGPEAILVVVTPPFAGILDDVMSTVSATLAPTALIGCAAPGLLAAGELVEGAGAIAAIALASEGTTLDAPLGFHLPPGAFVASWRRLAEGRALDGSALVLVAARHSPELVALLEEVAASAPGCTIVGGTLAAGDGTRGSLAANAEIADDGVVGLLLSPGSSTTVVAASGTRPITHPHLVTATDGPLVLELDGRPALDVVLAAADDVAPEDRRRMAAGLVLESEVGWGDRGAAGLRHVVLGTVREVRAVALDAPTTVGATVRLAVHDQLASEDALGRALVGTVGSAALAFAPVVRSDPMAGGPRREAEILQDEHLLGPVAGLLCHRQLAGGAVAPPESTAVLVFEAQGDQDSSSGR